MKKQYASLVILLAVPGLAQQRSGLHARELFYTPPPEATVQTPKPPDPPKQTPANPPKTEAKSKPKENPPKGATQAKTTPPAAGTTGTTGSTPDGTHVLQASVPLGLRYAVLKRDAAGKFQETDPDTNFQTGDRIRLQVDANTSGYLYLLMQGSSGTWRLLFPSPEVAGGSNLVRKGQSLQIPPGDRGQFVFDETAGTEKLFLVLTRKPEADLDKLIYSMGGNASPADQNARMIIAQASVRDSVVDRLRGEVQSRDLVFEKVDTSTAAPATTPAGTRVENAAYVVNPSTAPDARLVVDLALRHR